jgi:UDP-3-O-[3-hydroxymyristoyl] glucosamine N-acyltransferase
MKFSEIVEKLGEATESSSLSVNPDLDPEITGVAPVDEAFAGTLSFIDGGKFAAMVGQTAASALIVPRNEAMQARALERGIVWIACAEPRLLFAKAIDLFYQPFRPAPEIHPTAVIHPSAEIGKEVYIGPHVVIQAGAKIGDEVCIHPNVVIYPEAQIGDRTTLHANCTIHERARIGADCVIHSGAAIGSEGFGFVLTSIGWIKMEQSGRTVLEDGVEVGCNSAIDRPAAGETRVGRNTKIDNLVQIGHSCQVGQDCLMAGQSGVAGSVKIGNRVILAGQVGVVNLVKIGDGAIATARTLIQTDVAPGVTISGYPGVPHKLWLRTSVLRNRLPEIYQSLKHLEKLIEEQHPELKGRESDTSTPESDEG